MLKRLQARLGNLLCLTGGWLPLAIISFLWVPDAGASNQRLWYDKPAQVPLGQGLCIGNGHMGGIIMGGVITDRVYLDDSSLWTGDANASGNYDTMGSYQCFGSFAIKLPAQTAYSDYSRVLDLGDAVASDSYVCHGVKYAREYFASNPANVMVVRLTANARAAYTGSLTYMDSHAATVSAQGNAITAAGALSNAMRFGVKLLVLNEGGKLATSPDGEIQFTDCSSLTIIIACGTNYVADAAQNWLGPDPAARIARQADEAATQTYDSLRAAQLQDCHQLFNRVTLDLGPSPDAMLSLPTDQRIAHAAKGEDPQLEALLFQYGRYLLISCSRAGGLPANLQGLWNASNDPAWHGDYHTNINIQMAYWGAEVANLSECHLPLFAMIQSQLPLWRQEIDGLSAGQKPNGKGPRGWTVRVSHNIHGGMGWKWNTAGNAWYCLHLWEHYAFTRDTAFLRDTAYPIMKEACEFWQDTLKPRADGTLVAPATWSHEHGPDEDGVSYAQEWVWNLFDNYIQASETLGVDAEYRATIAGLRDRLLKPRIGKWGQLQEWVKDIDDPNDHHRHTSHLVALYPAAEFAGEATPMTKAAEVSLVARGETGDSQSEWSAAWRTGLWARLRNGNMARHWLDGFFSWGCSSNLIGKLNGTNQWDGDFGFSGTIPEMLLQSQAGVIDLLPALPTGWPNGSFTGLRARGGYQVDASWRDGALSKARVRADFAGPCRVRSMGSLTVTNNGQPVPTITLAPGITQWTSAAGETFDLVPGF